MQDMLREGVLTGHLGNDLDDVVDYALKLVLR